MKKTTIDLPDELLRSAKESAHAHKTTLRALISEGLRLVLAQRGRAPRYRMPDCSFGVRGGTFVPAGVVAGDWEALRAAIYEGRGG